MFIMAKQQQKENFLGGFSFNEAGATATPHDPAGDDSGPIVVPSRPSPQNLRTVIIVAVILLLAGVLYVVGDYGLGGVTHTQGHGVSPDEKPTIPDRNF